MKSSTSDVDCEFVYLILTAACNPHFHAIAQDNGLRHIKLYVAEVGYRGWGSAVYSHGFKIV